MPHVTEEIWSQLPDREARLIVSPWPERGRDASPRMRARSTACRRRRRSSAGAASQVELGSDDERRIFAAVVRPERARVDGNRDAEIERLRKEVARAEGMLANERFVAERAGRGRRRGAREARALPPRARRRSTASLR